MKITFKLTQNKNKNKKSSQKYSKLFLSNLVLAHPVLTFFFPAFYFILSFKFISV
jgi:hypothetical protein